MGCYRREGTHIEKNCSQLRYIHEIRQTSMHWHCNLGYNRKTFGDPHCTKDIRLSGMNILLCKEFAMTSRANTTYTIVLDQKSLRIVLKIDIDLKSNCLSPLQHPKRL